MLLYFWGEGVQIHIQPLLQVDESTTCNIDCLAMMGAYREGHLPAQVHFRTNLIKIKTLGKAHVRSNSTEILVNLANKSKHRYCFISFAAKYLKISSYVEIANKKQTLFRTVL
jgi:hypothetical protein